MRRGEGSDAGRREWQIAITGTFDVSNYGDLLFPWIAEAELRARLGRVTVRRFSYFARARPGWSDDVSPLAELPGAARDLDGLLVGGGHLIRFDKEIAPGYAPPAGAGLHHPTGYWLTPALIALARGRPVIWNAPGVHGPVPTWAEPLMRLAVGQSGYVAVRDEPSRHALLRFAPPSGIAVVPDTAFGVSRLVDTARPSRRLVEIRESAGLHGRYVVVQASRALVEFARLLRVRPELRGDLTLLSLPIGPVHGDDDAVLGPELPGGVRLEGWPEPLVIAELIAHAEAVVGTSLHLAITALAFGVPVLRPPGTAIDKHLVLQAFDGVSELPKGSALEPGWLESVSGRRPVSSVARAAGDRLHAHWNHVAEALAAGGEPAAPEAVGRLCQALPALLEAAGPTVDATRRAEGDARIEALEAAVAALQGSWSWRLTRPLRALRHLQRRLGRRRNGRG